MPSVCQYCLSLSLFIPKSGATTGFVHKNDVFVFSLAWISLNMSHLIYFFFYIWLKKSGLLKGIVGPKIKICWQFTLPQAIQCWRVCLLIRKDLEKFSITSLAHQWIHCSEWVPSEWVCFLEKVYVSYKHALFSHHKILIEGILVDYYCDVLISCLDSHCDDTHSLHRIHWWASDVMLNF